VTCGRRPISKSEKTRDGLSGAGLFEYSDDVILPAICPDVSNFIENAANQVRQIETDPASCAAKMKKPAAGFPARAL
jgi:hypothetical protein